MPVRRARHPVASGSAGITPGSVREAAKLNVVIWGPPDASYGPLYNKRCQIRDLIIADGHNAEFSEDVFTPATLARSGLNVGVEEHLEALGADYIIVILHSPGTIGEVHDFAKRRNLACKMMICVDKIHSSGYTAKSTLRIFKGFNGNLDWFTSPDDIDGCHLAGRVMEQIKLVYEAKQSAIMNGGI